MLKSRNDNVLELESQIGELKSSLAATLAEVETKTTSMGVVENDKAAVEAQLKDTQASLNKLEGEVLDINVTLSSMQKEV